MDRTEILADGTNELAQAEFRQMMLKATIALAISSLQLYLVMSKGSMECIKESL